jgi:hypothetical protein
LAGKRLTPNQVVAYNLRRARRRRQWTQAEAAEELEPYLGERWSVATVSAAEQSFEGKRIRQFDADVVAAFSLAFGFPVAWFFVPPETARVGVDGARALRAEDLVKRLVVDGFGAVVEALGPLAGKLEAGPDHFVRIWERLGELENVLRDAQAERDRQMDRSLLKAAIERHYESRPRGENR